MPLGPSAGSALAAALARGAPSALPLGASPAPSHTSGAGCGGCSHAAIATLSPTALASPSHGVTNVTTTAPAPPALQPRATLSYLWLERAQLRADGAAGVITLLASPLVRLVELWIGGNGLGDAAAADLADAVPAARALRALHLERNEIRYAGADALLRSALASATLHGLYLEGNLLTDYDCIALHDTASSSAAPPPPRGAADRTPPSPPHGGTAGASPLMLRDPRHAPPANAAAAPHNAPLGVPETAPAAVPTGTSPGHSGVGVDAILGSGSSITGRWRHPLAVALCPHPIAARPTPGGSAVAGGAPIDGVVGPPNGASAAAGGLPHSPNSAHQGSLSPPPPPPQPPQPVEEGGAAPAAASAPIDDAPVDGVSSRDTYALAEAEAEAAVAELEAAAAEAAAADGLPLDAAPASHAPSPAMAFDVDEAPALDEAPGAAAAED